MPQGSRATYDKRTHRRVWQRTNRLTYIYFAGKLIDDLTPEEIAEAVLTHLEQAQAVIRGHWGAVEWERLAPARMTDLDALTQNGLRLALGEETFAQAALQPMQDLPPADIATVKDELGRRALTEVYRPLVLSVITDLWVEYLTQMEALRVSIGLEAYAQRDPLVQYKTRASELFQELFSNMRLGVVSRMFTFRPRAAAGAQASTRRGKEAGESISGALPGEEPAGALSAGNGEPAQAGTGSSPEARLELAEPAPDGDEGGEGEDGELEATLRPEKGAGDPRGQAEKPSKSKKRRRHRR
jgi:preprotein translocase subunit SecA